MGQSVFPAPDAGAGIDWRDYSFLNEWLSYGELAELTSVFLVEGEGYITGLGAGVKARAILDNPARFQLLIDDVIAVDLHITTPTGLKDITFGIVATATYPNTYIIIPSLPHIESTADTAISRQLLNGLYTPFPSLAFNSKLEIKVLNPSSTWSYNISGMVK